MYLEPDHPVSLFDMYFKNLQIRLNGFANAETAQWQAMQLLAAGAIDPASVITHRVSLDGFPEAAAAFAARADGVGKLVIRPCGSFPHGGTSIVARSTPFVASPP